MKKCGNYFIKFSTNYYGGNNVGGDGGFDNVDGASNNRSGSSNRNCGSDDNDFDYINSSCIVASAATVVQSTTTMINCYGVVKAFNFKLGHRRGSTCPEPLT